MVMPFNRARDNGSAASAFGHVPFAIDLTLTSSDEDGATPSPGLSRLGSDLRPSPLFHSHEGYGSNARAETQLKNQQTNHGPGLPANSAPLPMKRELSVTGGSRSSPTSSADSPLDPLGSNLTSLQPSPREQSKEADDEMAGLSRPPSAAKTPQQLTPPSSTRVLNSRQTPKNGSPKKQTPKRTEWTVDKIAESLQAFSNDIKHAHRELCQYVIKSTRPIDTRVHTGVDFFAATKIDPVPEEPDVTLKIKFKQHIRGKKDQREMNYEATPIKTNKDRVPPYRFHHTEITKNVLTPNTMLKFVPVLRDLEPSEERDYNLWLKELERMDASCGFKPMGSREQRVAQTTQKEKTAALSLFLDSWLKKLAIADCNRPTLIRHMASQESDDAITPQQKSSIFNLHSEDNQTSSPRAARTAAMFTEAFDRVFTADAPRDPRDKGVALRDILLLDKSVDDIVDSKKVAKVASQDIAEKEKETPESFIETYVVMGCLICYSNSCEHGDYGPDNHKRNFSLDSSGMYGRLFAHNRVVYAKEPETSEPAESPPLPCKRQCYRIRSIGSSGEVTRPWSEEESLVMRALLETLDRSRVKMKAQCAAAEILNRDCWDVHRHLVSLSITLPPVQYIEPPKVKPLQWYDRNRKMLMGDWQDHTDTHDYKLRTVNDPCHHDGPCSAANECPCVMSNVLCERFCRCTSETCAYKFTGCACHASGMTCQAKQKEGKPCICVQLNRECDPLLCGSCGARERADPANVDNDVLLSTGCQNCSLQRGGSKSLVIGQSQLDGCGYGLFTVEDIAAEEFVIEYNGELILHDEGVRREARRGEAFEEGSVTSYVFSLLDFEGIWVDAALYGNLSRYINHAEEDNNVEPKILYVNGEYRIRFSATRNIRAGEELFFNYGDSFPNLTKKMIKDKADKEDAPTGHVGNGARDETPPKKGRRRGEKGASKRLNKRGRTTGARKEAPKMTNDDYEALVDFDVPAKSRKRKRVMIGSDEEEEYRPSMAESLDKSDSHEHDDRGARRAIRRKKSARTLSPEVERAIEVPGGATATPVKRGRGRPPRVRRPTPSPPPDMGLRDDEEMLTPTAAKLRRERRPRVVVSSPPTGDAMDISREGAVHVTPTSAKPRRGRPPKVRVPTPLKGAEAATGEATATVTPSKARRGRPPKSRSMDVASDSEDIFITRTSSSRRTAGKVLSAVELSDAGITILDSEDDDEYTDDDNDDGDEDGTGRSRNRRERKRPARFRATDESS